MSQGEMPDTRVENLLEIGHRDRERRCYGGAMIQSYDGRYYWVSRGALGTTYDELPTDVCQQLEKREHIANLLAKHVDGMFEFAGDPRAPEFVRALDAKVGRLQLNESLMNTSALTPELDTIPIAIAQVGQTAMFAYLAAHGFGNTEIAEAFEVSESTVRVNLSKFKN